MTDPMPALTAVLRRTRRRVAGANTGDAAFVALAAGGLTGAILHAAGSTSLWPPVAAGVVGVVAVWRRPPGLGVVADLLDTRHDLSNLLGSAWATRGDPADAWRTTLRTLAATRAAALPPLRDVARFSRRRRACGLAAVVAVWLAAGLVPQRDAAGGRVAAAGNQPPAADDFSRVAAVVRRQPDTAAAAAPGANETKPEAASTTAARARKAATGDADARGPGRADADGRPAVFPELPPSAAPGSESAPGPDAGASGRVAMAAGDGPGDGGVVADPSGTATRGDHAAGGSTGVIGETAAAAVPDAYRDLVRDYFAR